MHINRDKSLSCSNSRPYLSSSGCVHYDPNVKANMFHNTFDITILLSVQCPDIRQHFVKLFWANTITNIVEKFITNWRQKKRGLFSISALQSGNLANGAHNTARGFSEGLSFCLCGSLFKQRNFEVYFFRQTATHSRTNSKYMVWKMVATLYFPSGGSCILQLQMTFDFLSHSAVFFPECRQSLGLSFVFCCSIRDQWQSFLFAKGIF